MNHDPALPAVVDRATAHAAREALLAREKAHTREGDALAAARRRLPMVEVDATLPLVGPDGPVTVLDAFDGRSQLLAYVHMWHTGRPAAEQCEGCTFYNGQVRELAYLHSHDVTYAVFCRGPYDESVRYRDFLGLDMPWYSAAGRTADALLEGRPFLLACFLRVGDRVFETYRTSGRGVEAMDNNYALLDLTPLGRQEDWEDTPAGRARPHRVEGGLRTGGRPSAQWSRLAAGHDDDLTPAGAPAGPASSGPGRDR